MEDEMKYWFFGTAILFGIGIILDLVLGFRGTLAVTGFILGFLGGFIIDFYRATKEVIK